jgi:hypothetical protein
MGFLRRLITKSFVRRFGATITMMEIGVTIYFINNKSLRINAY